MAEESSGPVCVLCRRPRYVGEFSHGACRFVSLLCIVHAYLCVSFVFFVPGSGWTLAVLAGVLAGCGGRFLPGDRGLSPLSFGVPWAAQSALYGSAFYCYCCCCSGIAAGECVPQVGATVRCESRRVGSVRLGSALSMVMMVMIVAEFIQD